MKFPKFLDLESYKMSKILRFGKLCNFNIELEINFPNLAKDQISKIIKFGKL